MKSMSELRLIAIRKLHSYNLVRYRLLQQNRFQCLAITFVLPAPCGPITLSDGCSNLYGRTYIDEMQSIWDVTWHRNLFVIFP